MSVHCDTEGLGIIVFMQRAGQTKRGLIWGLECLRIQLLSVWMCPYFFQDNMFFSLANVKILL